MNTYSYNEINNKAELEKPLMNFKRIWYRVIRYWYFIVISVVVSLVMAFVYNRYSSKIYVVSASIIIKESEEAGQTAELLYNNPLINAYRNFLNEPYIIKSYPLLQEVVDSLGITVALFKEGNIKTSELYKSVPIKVSGNKIGDNYLNGNYEFHIIDSKHFTLAYLGEKKDDSVTINKQESYLGTFNKSLELEGYKILINKNGDLDDYYNESLILSFRDGYELAVEYSNKLTIEWAEEGASVVNMSIKGNIAQKERDFLEQLIENYAFRDLTNKKEAAFNSKVFIDKQLKYISDSLLLVEMQLERFKNKNSQVDLGDEAKRILYKLDDLEKSRVAFTVKENYYQYLNNYLKDENSLEQIVLPTTVGLDDPVIIGLISKMTDLQLQAKILEKNSNSENPLAIRLMDEIKDLRIAILQSIKNLRATDNIAITQINKELHLLEWQLNDLPKEERQLVTIERTYHLGENLYVFLTQKRTEAAISEASTTSDIMVVNPPSKLSNIIWPKFKLNYLLAIAFGLLIPFSFFLLKELFNNKVQSREDLELYTEAPIIGAIGHNSDPQRMVVSNNPKSGIAEAFRSLRSNLNYFVKRDKFVLMITSSISGEGKSFTALNLANVLAISGKKTLLLGADMRKPRLFEEMGLSNSVGLSSILTEQIQIKTAIQSSSVENLYVITSGPIPPNPGELLLRNEFKLLIDKLKNEFEVILIDTPPIGIVADALEVAPLVDHTIFITRQNFTPKEAIVSLQYHLDQGKLVNISVVFNDIYKSGLGYGYGYGYGYGRNDKGEYYS